MTPNFSAYPWDRVAKLSRREAALHSLIARWIGARGANGEGARRLAKLVSGQPGDVRARIGRTTSGTTSEGAPSLIDPYAAACTVRVGGGELLVLGASGGVRAIAQKLLGGPDELAAPRPLGVVEQSIWSLVVATALEDLGVAGQVWPIVDDAARERARASAREWRGDASGARVADASRARGADISGAGHADITRTRGGWAVLDVELCGIAMTVWLGSPDDLELRAPPPTDPPAWTERLVLDIPLVVGRCAIRRADLLRLAPRQLVTLEPPTTDSDRRRFRAPGELRADLDVLSGAIGLRGSFGAVVAEACTSYIPRDMALPDDAHVELTVAVGTTQLSLRQLLDLSVGQVVTLGRPLAGPFEVRAEGRVLGRGELVDVDGELAVRIVSLGD